MSDVIRMRTWGGPLTMMQHVTHIDKSCLTHKWVKSHIWINHVTHKSETCYIYEWVISHRNESWHTYEHMRGTDPISPQHVQHLFAFENTPLCCSVLQCVAEWCSVMQCVAACYSVLQCVAVCCSVLQCVVVCCSVLQCVAVFCGEFVVVSCDALQCAMCL